MLLGDEPMPAAQMQALWQACGAALDTQLRLAIAAMHAPAGVPAAQGGWWVVAEDVVEGCTMMRRGR